VNERGAPGFRGENSFVLLTIQIDVYVTGAATVLMNVQSPA